MHDFEELVVSIFYFPHYFFLYVVLAILLAQAAYPIGQIVGAIAERRWPRCHFIVIDLAFLATASLSAYLIHTLALAFVLFMWPAMFGALMGAWNRNWPIATQIAERLIGHVGPKISAYVTESQQWQSLSIALPFIISLGLSWYLEQSTSGWAASVLAIAGIVSVSMALFHIPIVKRSIVRISHHHLPPFAVQITFITILATITLQTAIVQSLVQTLSALIIMGLMWPISLLTTGLGFVLTIPYLSAWYLAFCTGIVFCTLWAMAEFSPVSTTEDKSLPPWKSLLTAIVCVLAVVQIVWLALELEDHLAAGYVASILTAIGVRFVSAMKRAQQSGHSRKDAVLSALPLEYLTFVLFLDIGLSLPLAFPLPRALFWISPLVAALLYYKSSVLQLRSLPSTN